MSSTKLFTEVKQGIIGYNHLIKAGSSTKSITSDIAHYLLLSDLNTICDELNKHLKIELPKNKLCALISYFHSKHIQPSPSNLDDVNNERFKLASERLFCDRREPRETRALRMLEQKLWNSEDLEMINLKISNSAIL
jgi:hypothetical protein